MISCEIQDKGGCHLENFKSQYSSAVIWDIFTKFDMWANIQDDGCCLSLGTVFSLEGVVCSFCCFVVQLYFSRSNQMSRWVPRDALWKMGNVWFGKWLQWCAAVGVLECSAVGGGVVCYGYCDCVGQGNVVYSVWPHPAVSHDQRVVRALRLLRRKDGEYNVSRAIVAICKATVSHFLVLLLLLICSRHWPVYSWSHASVDRLTCSLYIIYISKDCKRYTPWVKKTCTKLLPISSPTIDRFKNSFHWHTLWTICNNVVKYPTTS